ncbi:protein Lines homolog 1 [Archocentrus centrarchus]|uniref:protein Lines homolog 1 n=1 Tax=Archocentrus centrarchus TaxID=63155 RepID=UPI0011E9F1F1|nr:protein Lines homolog 1 [Archocentrus centrarchus]
MEHTASCKDQSIKTGFFNCLTEAYRCFLAGTCPEQSAADVASMIYSGFRGLVPGKDREGSPLEYCNENIAERTCIMSFVERISSSLTSQALPPDVTFYCVEVLKVLFEDMDLMPYLVYQFQAEDHIISHLAAKTASKCVYYLIHKSGTISPVWQKKCEQTFQSSPPGLELDACLWSLTDVSKNLLKGAHREFVMTLLAGFDSSLSALCSKLFPEEKKEMSQCVVDFTRSAHWGTTFCLMLDLLEVLTTSSLVCGPGSCLKSQRLTYHHSLALLTISCSSEYYVKKRVLLFLKRAVLQKVGEDWTSGVMASTQLRCGNWSSDMSMLAQTVLAAADNWLQSVQVESAAFFGGTRHIVGDESPNSDCVVLRAVSLILLKSIEIHIQTAAGSGMDTATKVHASLQSLWGFLRRCSFRLREVTHLCCWISLLFGEQDDDMMEAARALLFIFLHYRLSSGLDEAAALEAACASGFNPHCHFVFLLQSISFDHSILLDFLISAETCFLEYFVQYLKYLRDDWQGLKAACGGITVSALCGDKRLTLKDKGEPDQVESGSCVQRSDVSPPGERFCLPAELRLVDYESSDESDPENTQDPEVQLVASVCEKSTFTSLNVNQCESTPASLTEPNSTLETRAERLLQSHSEQTSCTNMSPLSWQLTGEISVKAVLCLSELREVVMRLHTKKLFPYNPSSLFKLLAQVESCYQKSSQFSKS